MMYLATSVSAFAFYLLVVRRALSAFAIFCSVFCHGVECICQSVCLSAGRGQGDLDLATSWQPPQPLWLPQLFNQALRRQCTCVGYVWSEQ